MATLIQFRRGTGTQWSSANPVLNQGELGLVTDTGQYKIGNGVTAWNSLAFTQLVGDLTTVNMPLSATPSVPDPNNIIVFGRAVGGRALPAYIGPSGIASALQPFLARNKIGYWCPPGNATTVPGVLGYTAPTAVGTATVRNVTTGNLFTRMRRLGYVSAAGAGSLASVRVAVAQVTLGDGTLGGFHKVIRFGTSDASTVAGARMFMGVNSSTSAPTNVEPSTLTNSIGVGHGAADTNLKVFHGGSAAQTPIDLGANFPANTLSTDVYDLVIFAPLTGGVQYEVTRLNTGHVATGTIPGTSGVAYPLPTTLLTYNWGYRTNNATALAVGLDIMSDYIETDY